MTEMTETTNQEEDRTEKCETEKCSISRPSLYFSVSHFSVRSSSPFFFYGAISVNPACRNCSLIDFTSLFLISLQLDNASASDFCNASDAATACVVGVESAPSTRFITESSSLASLAR